MKFIQTYSGHKVHILCDEKHTYCGLIKSEQREANSHFVKVKRLYMICYKCESAVDRKLNERR